MNFATSHLPVYMGDDISSQQGSGLDGRGGLALWTDLNSIFGSRTAREHAQHLVPHLKPDMSLLDVGSGLSSISMDFAAMLAQGSVQCIDTDAKALSSAQEKAKLANLTNIEFSVGDVYDLSCFSDGAFDVVHAHQVMLHLAEPVKALREMRRVLKPGAILSLRDGIEMMFVPEDAFIQKSQAWYRDFARSRGGNPGGGLKNHIWVHEAGFEWDNMQMGSASWEFSGSHRRRIFAQDAKSAFRGVGLKLGYGTVAEFDEIEQHWLDWAKKDDGRAIGLDSTVIAWK